MNNYVFPPFVFLVLAIGTSCVATVHCDINVLLGFTVACDTSD